MAGRLILLAGTLAALLLVIVRGEEQSAQSAGPLFELKPVVDGVYAALARPVHKINCNAVVIVLDDGVMVVDAHSKPSAAQALMAQIKTITTKPVKYVVNTHFHWDHAQGDAAYPAAWPTGLEIISAEVTRESIEERGIPRIRRSILDLPAEIASLRANLAKVTAATARADLQDRLTQTEQYLAELQAMPMTLPTLTLDRSLVLHGRTRTVQILWLGKAHTDGDVVVYLPRERFVATGDMLHQWTPFMADSYPSDWVKTLTMLEQLDFEYAVGGHGDVMRGKTHLGNWKRYFQDLMRETTEAYATGASIELAVARVSATLVPRHAGYMPSSFRGDIVGNIQKAYRVVSGQVN
jgi:glyoxylase-like metal-dependent hydrolase (beta-lactamase superfamily II)